MSPGREGSIHQCRKSSLCVKFSDLGFGHSDAKDMRSFRVSENKKKDQGASNSASFDYHEMLWVNPSKGRRNLGLPCRTLSSSSESWRSRFDLVHMSLMH